MFPLLTSLLPLTSQHHTRAKDKRQQSHVSVLTVTDRRLVWRCTAPLAGVIPTASVQRSDQMNDQ